MTVTKPSVARLTADPVLPPAGSGRQPGVADRAGEPPSGRRFAATLAAVTAPRGTARVPVQDRPVSDPSKPQDAAVRDDQEQQAQPDPAAATVATTSAVTMALTVIAPGPTAAAAGPEVPAAQDVATAQTDPVATSLATVTAATPPTASPSTGAGAGAGQTPADALSPRVGVVTAGGTVVAASAQDVDPAPAGTTGPVAGNRADLADGQAPAGPAEQSANGSGSGAPTGQPGEQPAAQFGNQFGGQPGGQGTAPWVMVASAGPADSTATSTAARTGSTVATALTSVGPQRGRAAITDSDPGPTAASAAPEQQLEQTTAFGAIGPTGGPTSGTTGAPNTQAAPGSADPAAAGAAPVPPAVDQVTKHLLAARLLSDGTHHTVMHLSPEHLGPVTVTVDVRDGAVRLELVGGSGALGALGQGLDSLRSQLADAGLDLADVAMRPDDQAGNPFGRGPGERRPDGGQDGGQTGAPGARTTDQPIEQPASLGDVPDQTTDQVTPNPTGHRGRLDVRV